MITFGQIKHSGKMLAKQAQALAGYYTAPAFLIIGVEKGGTTALHYYLGLHPQIVRRHKEILFFDENYRRGLAWYHSHFPLPYQMRRGRVTFEGTPHYLFLPYVAERIYRYNPHIKLIAILRDPVDRALSAWNMPRLRVFKDLRGFDVMVLAEVANLSASVPSTLPLDFRFVERGLYYEQLMRYFAFFPREQVLILENAAMKRDTAGTLRRTTTFLGLADFDWEAKPEIKRQPNTGEYTYAASMLPETRARLAAFFRPHNQKLYELLGVDYGWQ